MDVVQALLAACPTCATVRHRSSPSGPAGKLPLELAVCSGASSEVIAVLLQAQHLNERVLNECFSFAYPSNHDGARAFLNLAPPRLQQFHGTALHWALRSRKDRNSVDLQQVMDAFPDAIRTPNNEGRLPLSFALTLNETEAAVQLLLEAYPMAASRLDNESRYALHHACMKALKIDGQVYTSLINAFPDALRWPDIDSKLPLHHALEGHTAMTVEELSLIVGAHPAALGIGDRDGKTPLDAFFWQSVKYIQRMNDMGKIGTENLRPFITETFSSKFGYLGAALIHGISPAEAELDIGTENSVLNLLSLCYAVPRCPMEVLRCVAMYNRDLISRRSGESGRLPLHYESALSRDNAGDGMFVNGLIRAHSKSLSVRDPVTGKYPFELMLQNGRSWKTGVKLALMHFPQALNEHNIDEAVLPHMFARLGRDCTLNVLYILFHNRPDCCHNVRACITEQE